MKTTIDKNTIKILLIDNDEMMRIYFRDIFWIHGQNGKYDVSMVRSLEESELIIADEKTRPDILFIDILAPISIKTTTNSSNQIQDVLSFVKKIKGKEKLLPMKVILLLDHKRKNIERRITKFKADDYLIKGELMPKEIIAFTDKIHGTRTNN